MGTSATKAKNKFNKANYERISLVIHPEMKEVIKEVAGRKNESVNGYINEAVLQKLKKDADIKVEYPRNFKFSVFYSNELSADVDVRENEVFVKRYTLHPVKQIFYSDKMPRYKLGEILELRCWDKNRADLSECLNNIGLKEYNPYAICRKTHGITYADKIWFRFEDDYFDGIGKLKEMTNV